MTRTRLDIPRPKDLPGALRYAVSCLRREVAALGADGPLAEHMLEIVEDRPSIITSMATDPESAEKLDRLRHIAENWKTEAQALDAAASTIESLMFDKMMEASVKGAEAWQAPRG